MDEIFVVFFFLEEAKRQFTVSTIVRQNTLIWHFIRINIIITIEFRIEF